MRKIYAILLAALMALSSISPSPALASEGRGQPFITAEHYKENISLEKFQANPRSYFRSEAAFDLIVDYVGDEIGQPLTDSQFVALIRDDTQVRVRDCSVSERINTGAYDAGQFHWFGRACRAGEQIVQVKLNSRWIDVMSLNCLNAVEDPTPIQPPLLKVNDNPPTTQYGVVVVTTTVAPRAEEGSLMGPFLYGPVIPSYRGGNTTINAGSRSASSSTSTSTSGNGGCTTSCGHVPVQPGHIQGD